MKAFQFYIMGAVGFLLMAGAFSMNAAPAPASAATSNEVWSVIGRFVTEKHDLAEKIARKHKLKMPSQAEEFFAAAQKRDWNTTSNLFYVMLQGAGRGMQPGTNKWMPLEIWEPVLDAYGPVELYFGMSPKFVKMLGVDMTKGIPAGSIYFGGTDTGRFLATAFSKSHTEGRPFYTITQNALADPAYLAYVEEIYGGKISVPTTNDSSLCISNYSADAKARFLHDQKFPNEPRALRPGENVQVDRAGNVDFNNQISVMAINAMIVEIFFEKNPAKEFYVEESFPLDWMFPHLTPSGQIMKLNRAEAAELPAEVLKRDHEFWADYSGRLIGNWITYDTPVKEVTAFAEKVYWQHDLKGFAGDPEFIRDEFAQKAFSKLRSSIAGVYGWRLGQPVSGGEVPREYLAEGENRKRIEREAEFAFKQAVALCPTSPETVFRYISLLASERRLDDALLVGEAAAKLQPDNVQFKQLVSSLKAMKQQAERAPNG